jgi:hypothetical protein
MGWLPGMGIEIDTKKYGRNNEIETFHGWNELMCKSTILPQTPQ